MFHNPPYETWRDEELPRCLETRKANDMLFIGACSGIGADADTWIPFSKDMGPAGVKMVELDTGAHATLESGRGRIPRLNRPRLSPNLMQTHAINAASVSESAPMGP